MIYEIRLQTERRDDMLDITDQVEKILAQFPTGRRNCARALC